MLLKELHPSLYGDSKRRTVVANPGRFAPWSIIVLWPLYVIIIAMTSGSIFLTSTNIHNSWQTSFLASQEEMLRQRVPWTVIELPVVPLRYTLASRIVQQSTSRRCSRTTWCWWQSPHTLPKRPISCPGVRNSGESLSIIYLLLASSVLFQMWIWIILCEYSICMPLQLVCGGCWPVFGWETTGKQENWSQERLDLKELFLIYLVITNN